MEISSLENVSTHQDDSLSQVLILSIEWEDMCSVSIFYDLQSIQSMSSTRVIRKVPQRGAQPWV